MSKVSGGVPSFVSCVDSTEKVMPFALKLSSVNWGYTILDLIRSFIIREMGSS
jgi:hypothetical protein